MFARVGCPLSLPSIKIAQLDRLGGLLLFLQAFKFQFDGTGRREGGGVVDLFVAFPACRIEVGGGGHKSWETPDPAKVVCPGGRGRGPS